MSRFYFDCYEVGNSLTDIHGEELKDVQEATEHAACIVATMLGERVEATMSRAITVLVRAHDGSTVYIVHGGMHGHLTTGGA